MENLIGAEVERWPALAREAEARLSGSTARRRRAPAARWGHVNRLRPL